MAKDLVSRLRDNAARYRRLGEEARQLLADAATGNDDFTTITVNRRGDIEELRFAPGVISAGPLVWAGSLIEVYWAAWEGARNLPLEGSISVASAPQRGPNLAMPGAPVAPEQATAERRIAEITQRAQGPIPEPTEVVGESGAVRLVGTTSYNLISACAEPSLWPDDVETLTADCLAAWEQIRAQNTTHVR